MADLAHVVGSDLQIGPTGDLLAVSGADETRQRVLHRLLTSQSSYIWQLQYGAGLPVQVGQVASGQQIAAIIKSQMMLEVAVASIPEPVIKVAVTALGNISASITYTDNGDGSNQTVSFSVGA